MIRLDGLTVAFPERGLVALDDVHLTIRHGEHVALVGPSGAGKSTLLRALLGAVRPSAGSARVAGTDPWGSARALRELRERTGMIRQGNDLVLALTAALNIALGTAATWLPRDWVDAVRGRPPRRLVERVEGLAQRHGITDCLPARVNQLSGGQRQRVALCRALLPGPSLLLADEPTGQLDPAAAAGVLEALRSVEGVTLVVATHDLAVARSFPRQIALREGKVFYDGTAFDQAVAASVYGFDA